MERRGRNGVVLLGVSLVLFNAHYLIAYLEGDLVKSILLVISLGVGAVCLGGGAWLLLRRPRDPNG
ncbi:MAG: hypothetical protein HY908_04635 [Myxococcales bacterium]|nr:hypothetical protein [Myxococcales bacterium]